jgi:DNA-binding transcriptional ArsR family regulator
VPIHGALLAGTVPFLTENFDWNYTRRPLPCLEKARLIEKRRDGRLHICKLTPEPLKEVAEWTEKYRQYWEENFQRLDALLDELQERPERRRETKPRKRSDR